MIKKIAFIILALMLVSGCTDSYTEHKKDCLSQKLDSYCNSVYGLSDDPYCSGWIIRYKEEWKEDCRMEFLGVQPQAKEHVMVKVDFEDIDNDLMVCYDEEDYTKMNATEQYYFFDIWKTGDYDTEIREYKDYTEEIKYPEFEIDIKFPRDEFDSCRIRWFKIEKTITKENITYNDECDFDYIDYIDFNHIDGWSDFDYDEFRNAIIRCLTET